MTGTKKRFLLISMGLLLAAFSPETARASGYYNQGVFLSTSPGIWTWESGATTFTPPATYGTKGIPATTNTPGGRGSSAHWRDSSGNFWLFGGYGAGSNNFSDLWMYNPTTGTWTWVQGSSVTSLGGVYGTKGTGSTTNMPGSRFGSAIAGDGTGTFWLFGGAGADATATNGVLNDLWSFTPATSQWTWLAGSTLVNATGTYGTKGTGATTNIPTARENAGMVLDSSGNLWLYGGEGPAGKLADLWKFTPSNSQWTWVAGSSTINSLSVFGTLGVGSTAYTPGYRSDFNIWIDAANNIWLFGGLMVDGAEGTGVGNDLWRFNPTNTQWTWVSGSSTQGSAGNFGTRGIGATSNAPTARTDATQWSDRFGNLWLLGGYTTAEVNDLWKFQPATSNWTWISGSSTTLNRGIYGTQGVRSYSSTPAATTGSAVWVDTAGTAWLFGGVDESGLNTMDAFWQLR